MAGLPHSFVQSDPYNTPCVAHISYSIVFYFLEFFFFFFFFLNKFKQKASKGSKEPLIDPVTYGSMQNENPPLSKMPKISYNLG